MHRRVFVGIDLPAQVKKRLAQKMEKRQDLPVRWALEDNLHVTLSFLGYVNDSVLADICAKVRRACEDNEIFDIMLEEIVIAPSPQEPRMIWVEGLPSENLKRLQESIERELGIFQKKKRTFRPHVTLGRIRKEKWKKLPEIPEIREKFSALIPVESVEIFESVVEEGKRRYLLLESCPLK